MSVMCPRFLQSPGVSNHFLWTAIQNTKGKGAVIECGTYDGCSSASFNYVLRHYNTNIRQYACDTFDGFKEDGKKDELYKTGDLVPTAAQKTIKELERLGIIVLIGKVEDTLAVNIPSSEKFSFVFLDMDIEAPTKYACDFLKDRILPGGIIGFHDYGTQRLPGIKRVADQLLNNDMAWKEVIRSKKRGRDNKYLFLEKLI